MADKSKIEWTEATWNPVAGCTKCSPGCLNCYAERMAIRLASMGQKKYQETTTCGEPGTNTWNNKIYCDESALDIPLKWRKPRRIFVCSMSDLFHPKMPFEFQVKIFDIIRRTPRHTYQVLTKRINRVLQIYKEHPKKDWPIAPNLWVGVSISNPDEMWKAEVLSRIPAAVRFISFEPLLADVGKIPLTSLREDDTDLEEYGQHIDWVVVGGESGPGARPMYPDWARSIRDQCVAANVPFFFKQWGGVNKKKAGRMLDGREWSQYP